MMVKDFETTQGVSMHRILQLYCQAGQHDGSET